jgi:hypothetical protein
MVYRVFRHQQSEKTFHLMLQLLVLIQEFMLLIHKIMKQLIDIDETEIPMNNGR